MAVLPKDRKIYHTSEERDPDDVDPMIKVIGLTRSAGAG